MILGNTISGVTVFPRASTAPKLYVSGIKRTEGNDDSFVVKLE